MNFKGLHFLNLALVVMALSARPVSSQTNAHIPRSEIGAKAGADYHGDGLAVTPTENGARLRCVFQRLEGGANHEGLWLTSTVTNQTNDRFRVTAVSVGRLGDLGVRRQTAAATPLSDGEKVNEMAVASESCVPRKVSGFSPQSKMLPSSGTVSVDGPTVRFNRPGLVEEYSVSMDGVRQDFVLLEKPAPFSRPSPPVGDKVAEGRLRGMSIGEGELRVELAVAGAKVEQTAYGAQLVLEKSGRKIAYSRLHATDATGKELPARMEVLSDGARLSPAAAGSIVGEASESPDRHGLVGAAAAGTAAPRSSNDAHGVTRPTLAIVVNDSTAVYPVRIDPTFSDANWVSLGGIPGASGQVNAAVVDGAGNLYIGGFFSIVGNVIANNIAKWNGSSWSALGSGTGGVGANVSVAALAVSGSNLYAGGPFTTAGGSAANRVAKWDGNSWSALGDGLNSSVFALAVLGTNLYAGGSFLMAGGSNANFIAKWNGSNWSALGSGLNSQVNALAVSGSDLYAGGFFTIAGGTPASFIARWNGSSWSALGSGMNSNVFALAVSGIDLYAGGAFTTAGGSAANRVARWNGSSWSTLGSGFVGAPPGYATYVYALAVRSSSDLYAGGIFTTATNSLGSAVTVNSIAKWNGSGWSELGSGVSGSAPTVIALVVSGTNLFAGGNFTAAGGSAANFIARWNGSSWSALGSGMNIGVAALAVSGSDVYAGGGFTTAGGTNANRIARWDGSSWNALGSGMNGGVAALAVSGSDLYAGGAFTNAGGIAANRIAKWDGSNWSALGSGVDSQVNALAVSGSNLYAGGVFITAGGTSANRIARWDGSSWSALGSGMNNWVQALAVSETNVYAGGIFTMAGGSNANYIARWDGGSWSTLGSGMNNWVRALAGVGQRPVCGREFHDGGREQCQLHRQMGRGQLERAGVGDEHQQCCVGAGSVGQQPLRGGRFHDGRRKPSHQHSQMEREQLERAGFGDEQFRVHAGGVGQRTVCRGLFLDGGREGFSLRGAGVPGAAHSFNASLQRRRDPLLADVLRHVHAATKPGRGEHQHLVRCQLSPHHQRRDQMRHHSVHVQQPVLPADWQLSQPGSDNLSRFGPVLSMMTFRTPEEAFERANNIPTA